MDTTFWSGYLLENFLFNSINITSPKGLIGVCVITSALAFAFEGTKTLRDWLYVKFLNKRNGSFASTATGNIGIALHEIKSNGAEGREISDGEAKKNGHSPSSANGTVDYEGSKTSTIAAPVIATGTINGFRKFKKPKFYVGLTELCISTLLHMCQVCMGYVLMLVVMTFNVWIFVAVLAGVGVGFFVFDGVNKQIHSLKISANTK